MITEKVIGYVKKDIATREAMSEYSLELPAHRFKTKKASGFRLPKIRLPR